MGVDLSLIPIEHEDGQASWSHSLLNCERRSHLFEEILELKAHPVPERFNTFRARGCEYGNTQTTPYGDQLMSVYVGDLLSFKDHTDVQDNFQNRAVWAYLAELSPKLKVALFWH